MKKILSSLALIASISILLAACSKDTAPQDNDLFIGTYRGPISYNSADESISIDNGSITVSKVDNTYNFAFSDGIPNINGIKFEEEDDTYYINIGGSGTSYIRINKDVLKILYIYDGQTWTADCTR